MKKSVFLVLLALSSYMGAAQNYNLHALYIYSFSRYIIWPEDYTKGDFEILVLGETPLLDALQDMAQKKKVGDRTIKVVKINSPSEIRKCNILFIPSGKSGQLSDAVAKIANQSVVIITEEPGLGTKGSHINFIVKEGKLAFELNQAAVAKQNLKIANELQRLAILI